MTTIIDDDDDGYDDDDWDNDNKNDNDDDADDDGYSIVIREWVIQDLIARHDKPSKLRLVQVSVVWP